MNTYPLEQLIKLLKKFPSKNIFIIIKVFNVSQLITEKSERVHTILFLL